MHPNYRILVNIDQNSSVVPVLNDITANPGFTESDLYPFVDQYAGTAVTDLLFCIFGQLSATDSRVWTDYEVKYQQKVENGLPVDHSNWYRAQHILGHERGIDPFAVWIRRAKENGIRPWISVRMNDTHHFFASTCFLRSDFFYEAKQNGWVIGEQYGYRPYCLDYAVPQVRRRMLAYLKEQLETYDVYGIELDFMRDFLCFDYLNTPWCYEIMNDFMRQARKLANAAGEKWGHKIVLAVRLMRDIDQNKTFGFDAVTWAREGLVDLVSLAPFWGTCDDGIPIAQWKAALPGVAVQAGYEVMVNRDSNDQLDAVITPEVARALAVKYLSQGSDGIYLFNIFPDFNRNFADAAGVKALNDAFFEIYRTCGSLDEALSLPMRYVVMWQNTWPEGCTPWKPLPMALPADGSWQTLEIDLGAVPAHCKQLLTLGLMDAGTADVELLVNGKAVPLRDAGLGAEVIGFCEPTAHCLQAEIDPAADAKYQLRLRAASGRDPSFVYAEIFTDPT